MLVESVFVNESPGWRRRNLWAPQSWLATPLDLLNDCLIRISSARSNASSLSSLIASSKYSWLTDMQYCLNCVSSSSQETLWNLSHCCSNLTSIPDSTTFTYQSSHLSYVKLYSCSIKESEVFLHNNFHSIIYFGHWIRVVFLSQIQTILTKNKWEITLYIIFSNQNMFIIKWLTDVVGVSCLIQVTGYKFSFV